MPEARPDVLLVCPVSVMLLVSVVVVLLLVLSPALAPLVTRLLNPALETVLLAAPMPSPDAGPLPALPLSTVVPWTCCTAVASASPLEALALALVSPLAANVPMKMLPERA